jgi:hypothetical protein
MNEISVNSLACKLHSLYLEEPELRYTPVA